MDEEEARGVVDIDKLFGEDLKDFKETKESQNSSESDSSSKRRRERETPALKDRSDEDEEMFLKRRNYVEEDEYVSKKIVTGLPEYNEFKLDNVEEDESREAL